MASEVLRPCLIAVLSLTTIIDMCESYYMMCSSCGANELLHWKMPAGTLAGRARDMADIEWVSTRPCSLQSPVMFVS
jgi:hypothetical protein